MITDLFGWRHCFLGGYGVDSSNDVEMLNGKECEVFGIEDLNYC